MDSIRHWLAAAVVAAFGTPPTSGLAQSPRPHLNDTGQTRCADALDQWTDQCEGTGQDPAFGRDATHRSSADGVAGFAFVRVCHSGERAGTGACPALPERGSGPNDWGCTHDRVTGLTWELKTDDGGLRDWRRVFTYRQPLDPHYGKPADAAGYLRAVKRQGGLCGSNDWRLPRLTELFSLVNVDVVYPEPTIDSAFFPETVADGYWSADGGSADIPDAVNLAWFAYFGTGYVSPWWRRSNFALRLVRGEAVSEVDRYVVSADGQEVRDRSTSLTWRRCNEGQVLHLGLCLGAPLALDWHAALAHAQSAGGGWRMPNFKEMLSIVDTRLTGVVFDSLAFPGAPAEVAYWTSTIHMFPSSAANSPIVVTDYGESGLAGHELTFGLRLVRDTR